MTDVKFERTVTGNGYKININGIYLYASKASVERVVLQGGNNFCTFRAMLEKKGENEVRNFPEES